MISRRVFLRDGAATVVGLSTVPGFLTRTLAAQPGQRRKVLVVIFLRGAADGLNIVVPFKETAYYDYRPTIAIPPPDKPDSTLTAPSASTRRCDRCCRSTSRGSWRSSMPSARPTLVAARISRRRTSWSPPRLATKPSAPGG